MRKLLRPILATILTFVLLFLASCNPKPEIEKKEETPKNLYTIPKAEKLVEITPIFKETDPFIQGVERLSAFLGHPLTKEMAGKVYFDPCQNYVALTDILHLLSEEGLFLVYKPIGVDELKEDILKGSPVLIEFSFSGTSKDAGIVYGLDDDNLHYYLLPDMKERTYPIEKVKEKIEENKPLIAIIKAEDKSKWLEKMEKSDIYLRRWGQDVYQKRDPKAYKEYIETIERLNWRIKDGDKNQIYAYYYIFYDRKPEKVKNIILKSYEESEYLPSSQELAFMLYHLLNDKEKAERVASHMSVSSEQLSFYQDETLLQLGYYYLEKGDIKTAKTILEFLKERKPDYPGLKEALKEVSK
ncbi:MAG: tetratricopeptide repeat protein [Caldanaerobacter sp.]